MNESGKNPGRSRTLRGMIGALLFAVFLTAALSPLEARQDQANVSILGMGPSHELPDISLDGGVHEFRYQSLAAADPQNKPTATPGSGGASKKPPAPAASHSSLAQQATNPIADLIQMQFQNTFVLNSWNASGYANTFVIQPVIPIKLHNDLFPFVVTRTTLPIVTTPNFDGPLTGTTGSGDMVFLSAFINQQKWGMWGVGPTFTFATASDSRTGSGKWQAGPTAVVFVTKFSPWQLGFLAYNQFSFAGSGARTSVNTTYYQPVVVYHWGKGWYAGLPDVLSTFNWQTNEKSINFTGLRVGKVVKVGKQPLNLFLESWYSPVHDGPTGKWNIKASLTFLFPEG